MNLLHLMFLFPANWIGFLLGIGVAVGLSWNGRVPRLDWLAVALFNVPALICLYAQIVRESPVDFFTVASFFLITFYGVGGFGLGWGVTNIVIAVTRASRS
jgi:hypothetical protein